MAPVWFRFRIDLHRRALSWLGLGLLISISSAVVLFSVAGARRTDTAWNRLSAATKAHDVLVFALQGNVDVDAIAHLPEVSDSAYEAFVAAATDISEPFELTSLASPDGGFLGRIDRPKLVQGRRPNPARADEIAITPPLARSRNLKVGSTLTLTGLTPGQLASSFSGDTVSEPAGPAVVLRVVGIELTNLDLGQNRGLGSGDVFYLTPAFATTYTDRIGMVNNLIVRLKHGSADVSRFKTDVDRIAAGHPVLLTTGADKGSDVQHAIHTQALAIEMFAALAALATLLAIGQGISRQIFVEAKDHPTLWALGMSRSQLFGAKMLQAGAIGTFAAILAAVLAAALSPLMPLGLARLAEPSSGLSIDLPVFAGALLAIPALTMFLAALPAWRTTRTGVSPRTLSAEGTPSKSSAERVARLGLPPAAVTGVRFAVDPGRGPTAVPTRSAIAGVAFSIVAVMATLTFGASLDRLVSTPRLYGWNWDVVVGNTQFSHAAEVVPKLRATGTVGGFSAVARAQVDIAGVHTQAYGFDTVQGMVFPTVTGGRVPAQPDEMVLGAETLRAVHRHVGQVAEVRIGDKSQTFRIVGTAVFPALTTLEPAVLGNGVLLTADGLRRLAPEAQQLIFAIRFAAGVDRQAAGRDLMGMFHQIGFAKAAPPVQIADFGRLDNTPRMLSALLVLMAVASVTHALLTTIRRRRKELAILKTLGFTRRQVGATVACQATTMTVLALGIGLPLGAICGRWVWRIFANNLGVVSVPAVPLPIVLVAIPFAVGFANLIAAIPSRLAADTHPAHVLRSE